MREAPIRVDYTYDSYGVVRILRTPHPLEAIKLVEKAFLTLHSFSWRRVFRRRNSGDLW